MIKNKSSQHTQLSTPIAIYEAQSTITCIICSAMYTSTRSHDHVFQTSSLALESAFMSMCHFCFRCRRPSCPACWDEVNGICGSCVQDTELSFRTDAAMLSDLLLPPVRKAQLLAVTAQKDTHPLICVQAGRFQTEPVQAVVVEQMALPIDKQKTRPPTPQKITAPIHHDPLAPDTNTSVSMSRSKRIIRGIELFLTFVILTALVLVLCLIIAAISSATANTFIARIVGVDIRAEIAYLWQLIQQLR